MTETLHWFDEVKFGMFIHWEIGPHIINRAKPAIVLNLPPKCPDPVDTVVAIKVK